MNIDNIRAFLQIAKTSSFHRAAEQLNITQSTISARVRTLEERLGKPLFIRHAKGAALSEFGLLFIERAETILRNWEQARNDMALADSQKTSFGLGVQFNHWQEVALQWKNNMLAQFPNIKPLIRTDYSQALLRRLNQGVLDLALVYEPTLKSNNIIEDYCSNKLVMVSTQKRDVSDKVVEGYLYVDWGTDFNNQHNLLYPNVPYHEQEFGIADIAFHYMLNNGGSGYFLESMAAPYLKQKKLFLVNGAEEIYINNYLVYLSKEANNPVLQKAIEILKTIKDTDQTP